MILPMPKQPSPPRGFHSRIQPRSERVMEMIKDAKPPAPRNTKYFDSLTMPARVLLDKGFTMAQAADLLIEKRALARQDRRAFLAAMRSRMWRLKRKALDPALNYAWHLSASYNSAHLRAAGERLAVCGVAASFWVLGDASPTRCARCLNIEKGG